MSMVRSPSSPPPYPKLPMPVLVLMTLWASSACMSLSPDGQRVRVFPNGDDVSSCRYLGQISGSSSQWGRNGRERAQIELRNEAAILGGDSVVIKEDRGILAWDLIADVFTCSSTEQRKQQMLSSQKPPLERPKRLAQPERVLILGLKALDVDRRVGRIVSDLIISELEGVGNLGTVGRADIEAALDAEKQRDLLGCDEVSCLVEMGGALGTDLVLYGSVGPIGSKYAINVSLFNVTEARTRARVAKTVPRDEDALVSAVPDIVTELVAKLAESGP